MHEPIITVRSLGSMIVVWTFMNVSYKVWQREVFKVHHGIETLFPSQLLVNEEVLDSCPRSLDEKVSHLFVGPFCFVLILLF